MTNRIQRFILPLLFLLVLVSASAEGQTPAAIQGDAFLELVSAQDIDLQNHLEAALNAGDGLLVTGPMLPGYEGDGDTRRVFGSVRVVCPDHDSLKRVVLRLRELDSVRKVEDYVARPRKNPSGFRGAFARINIDGAERIVVVQSIQQTRWLVWMRDVIWRDKTNIREKPFKRYARAVSDYLRDVDTGVVVAGATAMPNPAEFGVHVTAGFEPPRPDYVIQGYDTYKRFLSDHAGVNTTFARGILAFVPTDSLLDAIASGRPRIAYPNKEHPLLQHEFEKFFGRGGDMSSLHVLTAERLASLTAGEYFFAVGVSGKVRFGGEMPREEIQRIEAESGRKVPRANHAFLFPGEAVLSAGAFFIGVEKGKIVRVNAQSGHYFYSNVSPSVRQDIAIESNAYVLTLGHFFEALARMRIDTHGILISKM